MDNEDTKFSIKMNVTNNEEEAGSKCFQCENLFLTFYASDVITLVALGAHSNLFEKWFAELLIGDYIVQFDWVKRKGWYTLEFLGVEKLTASSCCNCRHFHKYYRAWHRGSCYRLLEYLQANSNDITCAKVNVHKYFTCSLWETQANG